MNDRYKVQFHHEKTALRFFLQGKGYNEALKALGFAERHHIGLRKDGVTPEFHHQVEIALDLIQLKDVLEEELTFVAILLHDVQEDYQIPYDVIKNNFGERVADIVWKLTKKFDGKSKNLVDYIDTIAEDSVASIAKGIDRNKNLASMIGVFSVEKMASYAKETKDLFLPMLKRAMKSFPEQTCAYQSIVQKMKLQLKYIDAYVNVHIEFQNKIKQVEDKLYKTDVNDSRIRDSQREADALKCKLADKEKEIEILSNALNQAYSQETERQLECYKKTCEVIRRFDLKDEEKLELNFALSSALNISSLQLLKFNESKISGPIAST